MSKNDSIINFQEMIENVPATVFRYKKLNDDIYVAAFVTKNINSYGYNASDFESGSITWLDFVHPDDRLFVVEAVKDYETHKVDSYKLYYRVVKKNGEAVSVIDYNTATRNEKGEIIHYDSSLINALDNETNERLINSHYRQQLVINDILFNLHDSDFDKAFQIILSRTGAYLDTSRALLFKDDDKNEKAKIIYEWCNAGISSIKDFVDIDYKEKIPEVYQGLHKDGIVLVDANQIPKNSALEFELEGVLSSAIFAVYNNNKNYGFVCFDDCEYARYWDGDTVNFLRNIANLISTVIGRFEATIKLEQSQKTYEVLLNNVDSIIYVSELETRKLIFVNEAFKKMFGNQIEGKSIFDFIKPENLLSEEHGKNIRINEAYFNEEKRWISFSSETITWIDGRKVILTTGHDITSKKAFARTLEEKIEERTKELLYMTEEAKKAANAKTAFLANMSHEMRTPMNAIIGMTNICKLTNDPQKRDYCIEKIEEASIHLLGVINDILDMSKIEAGKLELSTTEFDYEKMLVRICNVLGYSINQKHQNLETEVSIDMPDYLYADEQHMSQVITNMLSNAVKFTPENGDIKLSTKVIECFGNECEIEVIVQDNGIGISKEQQHKLFNSFEQADSSISRKYGGTGLGLSISKSIANLMNGDIKVESEVGKGSKFIFTFIAKKSNRKRINLSEEVDYSNLRVLVVDDALEVREYFQNLASRYGFYCETANGASEAFEKIDGNKEPFHIIFVDWRMPGMNGIELARKIKEHGDSMLIMITAYEWSEIEEEARAAGIHDFVPKPLFPSAIVDCINKCLSHHEILQKAKSDNSDYSFVGKRILLVEDVEINREIVGALLEPTKVIIDYAVNGLEGFKKIEENIEIYDAVLMDIHMPEMDGYEATRKIRSLKIPKAKKIPIIAMTANVFKEDIEKCLAAGMNDHIGKPIDINDLLKKLNKYLD